jgi:hypothetical protein
MLISGIDYVVYLFIYFVVLLRAPLHLKADELANLNLQGLDLIFRSIRVQIRIPLGQNSHIQAFVCFQTRSFSTVARACARGCACLNNEKLVASARVVNKRALCFRTLLRSDRVSRATIASPWATRIAACSSRSPLSCTREKIFPPAVQGIKNAHLQQANASVCGRKKSLDPFS